MSEQTNNEKTEAFAAAAGQKIGNLEKTAVTAEHREAELEEFLRAFGETYTAGKFANSDQPFSINSSGELILTTDGSEYNLGMVKGAKGDTGAAGATGPQGPQGPSGAKGDKGDTGLTGAAGSNGANGADGKGWTGAGYDEATGKVTFSSDDGLEFTTGDLRGPAGPGLTGNITLTPTETF